MTEVKASPTAPADQVNRGEVLVVGASGFTGWRLCAALAHAGYDIAAMTRNPAGYAGAGAPVCGDVHAPVTLHAPMAGCQAAYYLVHSLSAPDFRRKDAAAATAFGKAAAQAGLQRSIYLGGLGDDTDTLPEHVRSRCEVESSSQQPGCRSPSSGPASSSGTEARHGNGPASWRRTCPA